MIDNQRIGKPPVARADAAAHPDPSTHRVIGTAPMPVIRVHDAPPDAPRDRRAAVYEYAFTRRRVADSIGSIRSPEDVGGLLREYLRPDETEQERLAVALLNAKNAVIGVETVYLGNASGCSVRVSEVYRSAVRLNACALVVAHNHPSGDPVPSPEDISLTRELAEAGRLLDIALLDHVILGADGRSHSIRASGACGPAF